MKEGRIPKDVGISDNFNTEKVIQPSKSDMMLAMIERRRKAREAGLTHATDIANYGIEKPPKNNGETLDDARGAYKMLQDMRWVYQNVNGKEKLKDLVEGDDKQFVFMVKELMKIEAALLAAKIRKTGEEEGKGVNQNVFVILKGLEEDKKFIEIADEDKDVDMRQLKKALNPDGSEMEDG